MEDSCPKCFSAEKNPKNPEITHTVTSNGSHPLHHHQIQTRRHSGRLLSSLFNGRTTMLQTFTKRNAKPPHCCSPPSGLQATDHHPSRQSTVKFDSLCSGPWSGTRLNQKKNHLNYLQIIYSHRQLRSSSLVVYVTAYTNIHCLPKLLKMTNYECLGCINFGLNEMTSQKFIKFTCIVSKSLYDIKNICSKFLLASGNMCP